VTARPPLFPPSALLTPCELVVGVPAVFMRVVVRHRISMMPCVLRAFLPRVRAGVGVSIRPTSENPSTSTHWSGGGRG
jgi:hypothetical protein